MINTPQEVELEWKKDTELKFQKEFTTGNAFREIKCSSSMVSKR